jgi:hypothetical protein
MNNYGNNEYLSIYKKRERVTSGYEGGDFFYRLSSLKTMAREKCICHHFQSEDSFMRETSIFLCCEGPFQFQKKKWEKKNFVFQFNNFILDEKLTISNLKPFCTASAIDLIIF